MTHSSYIFFAQHLFQLFVKIQQEAVRVRCATRRKLLWIAINWLSWISIFNMQLTLGGDLQVSHVIHIHTYFQGSTETVAALDLSDHIVFNHKDGSSPELHFESLKFQYFTQDGIGYKE